MPLQVKESLLEMSEGEPSGQLVVACFLLREGADIAVIAGNGQTPLDGCSPEIAVTASEFAEKYAG